MEARDGTRLVVSKDRLRGDFHKLQRALEEYRQELAASDGDDWPAAAMALLRRQQLGLLRARVSVGSGELGLALLQQVLRSVPLPELHFRHRTGAAPGEPEAAGPAGVPELRELVAALAAVSETAPLELQEKLHRTLTGILDFFSALAQHQAEEADAAMARINLATANVQSRSLLREIAIITRDVYNTLQAVSEELAIEALSDSSGSISEAVQRLNSVVMRLDDAANQNLDNLEKVQAICAEETGRLVGVINSLRASQKRLMQVKQEHPELEEELTRIQARLSDEVGAPVMTLLHGLGETSAWHMDLISNQSFQELTGRTLRKIIEFIQTLEEDLLDLLRAYRPTDEPSRRREAGPRAAEATEAAEATVSRTQSDVDKLLGDLGL